MEEQIQKLMELFFPKMKERQDKAEANNMRFVHYTSAEALANIIQTQKFWMRDSTCMNDYMEIEHGLECLIEAWGGPGTKRKIKDSLNECLPNISSKIADLFNDWVPKIKTGTFISCFSEHDAEDTLGRLSMWRAYGGANPVAVILNNEAFFNESDVFEGAYTIPVEYMQPSKLLEHFDDLSTNILRNKELIQSLGEEGVLQIVSELLKFTAICTKHPGFSEEREWRVIYCTNLPDTEESPNIEKCVEIIQGVPQQVCKIPLEDKPEEGLTGISIPSLFERIIIGPCEHPFAIYKAFVNLLEQHDVKDASSKVSISAIPIRT